MTEKKGGSMMRDPEKEYENAQDVQMEMKARDEDTTDEDMTSEEAAKWIQIYIDEWNKDLNQMKGFGMRLNGNAKKMMKAIEMGRDALKRTDKRTETHSCDCIERQAALDWLKNEWDGMVMSLFDGIKALPSAQPEIIRCKDCKYWMRAYLSISGKHGCNVMRDYTAPDDYCFKAERKE